MPNPTIRDPAVIAAISEELEGEDRPTHPLGGPEHTPSTIAELNAKLTDAILVGHQVTLHETMGAQTIIARAYTTSALQTGEDTLLAWRASVRAYDPVSKAHALWELLAAVKRVAGVLSVLSVQFINGPLKFGALASADLTVTVSGDDMRLNIVGVFGIDARWSVETELPVLVRDLDFP